ncbi:hypothetical protein JD844_033767, partial [Phrynosoma platyrhinos]
MKLVGLLAGRSEHLDTVISSLLQHSFPADSFAAEAIKLLLIRMGCRYEVTFMERMRGWAMLQSTKEVLQGAALLARAMLHFACPETMRILDLLFTLLTKGSEKLKPTTIAFFVEVEEVKAQMATLLGSLEETDGRVVMEGILAIQNLLKFMQRNDIVSLADKLLPLFSNVDAKARTSAIALFAELPNVVKKKEKYLIQEQVTQSVVPLLLHLQDEDPDVVKSCQEALAKCFRFLGWSLPKKINSKKAWHDHPQIAETLCRQIGDLTLQDKEQMHFDKCSHFSLLQWKLTLQDLSPASSFLGNREQIGKRVDSSRHPGLQPSMSAEARSLCLLLSSSPADLWRHLLAPLFGWPQQGALLLGWPESLPICSGGECKATSSWSRDQAWRVGPDNLRLGLLGTIRWETGEAGFHRWVKAGSDMSHCPLSEKPSGLSWLAKRCRETWLRGDGGEIPQASWTICVACKAVKRTE